MDKLIKEINYKEQNYISTTFQRPFAVILSCMDSRIPVSKIFNQNIGDIYNICIAGNFVDESIIASLELACTNESVKLIIIIGHNECSAIQNACNSIKIGNIKRIVSKIEPAIMAVKGFETNRTSSNKEFVEAVANKNVELGISEIYKKSIFLKEKIYQKKVFLIGAMYNIYTGCIDIKMY